MNTTSTAGAPPQFLLHDGGDSVAVAVTDLNPGPVDGAVLKTGERLHATVSEAVPLGHKFALADLAAGAEVIKYGVRIGIATQAIKPGEHVHVHNLRSARWPTSRAS